MKTINIIAVTLSVFMLVGCDLAPVPNDAPKSTVKIVSLPGMTKSQIMKKINLWIAESASSYNSIVQYKTDSTIVVKANTPMGCEGIDCLANLKSRFWYMMKVDVKPSKMRIAFSNFELSMPSSYNSVGGYSSAYRGPIHLQGDYRKALEMTHTMTNSLVSFVKSKNNSNW